VILFLYLEKVDAFPAPTKVRLNQAQLLALVDGTDWKKVRPATVKRPQSVG
jgi:transposase